MENSVCEFCRDPWQKYVVAPNGEYMHRAVHGCEIVWNKCRNEEARSTETKGPIMADEKKIDPRDPDLTRDGIFRTHNCVSCNHGRWPCVQGDSEKCEYPHARND